MKLPGSPICIALTVLGGLTPLLAQTPVLNPSASYGANMSNVKVAELNNDNAPEIIGLDTTSTAVVVLKNTGSGAYSAPQYYALSGQPTGLDVGDFNGDGKLDVAISFGVYNAANGKVAVLRGNGDGTLQMPVYFTVPIPANSIAVADLNNDNRPDIAVIGNTGDNTTNTVSILTNTSSTSTISFALHSFPAPVNFKPSGFGPDYVWSVTAGDFNGDGRIDLAYFDECGPSCGPAAEDDIVILANTTSGWVAKTPTSFTGASSMTAHDLDGDGITDLIIPYRGCHTPCVGVQVIYMKSDLTVANSVALDIGGDNQNGPTPYQVVAGDFNNDGKTDIAGYSGGGTVGGTFTDLPPGIMMWTGLGTRTFNSLKYYNQPSPPAEFSAFYTAAGFLDKNGTRDLVVPHGTQAQVWKNSTSTAGDPCSYPLSGGIHVCMPSGTVAAGTVHFLASARTNVQPLKRMELWVDGKKRAQRFSDRLHVDLTLAPGQHTASFFEVGASDLHIEKTITFTVK